MGLRSSLVVLVSLASASGCTLCPNPYDYSGPVPNGSVTQNDFCARSGGTRPLRSAPLVWPQVVQAETPAHPSDEPAEMLAAEEPTLAQDVVAAVAEEEGPEHSVIVTSGEEDDESLQLPSWRRLLR
ncbi:MAG: hypothetical protein ACO3NZ_11785 [Pirellulales bacterium]